VWVPFNDGIIFVADRRETLWGDDFAPEKFCDGNEKLVEVNMALVTDWIRNIRLANGKSLRTLRDAADHIVSLPPRETKQGHWQTAIAYLLSAAEKRRPLMMAHIAMKRPLGNGKASPRERLRRVAQRPRSSGSRRLDA
jgi:hypothetical protein